MIASAADVALVLAVLGAAVVAVVRVTRDAASARAAVIGAILGGTAIAAAGVVATTRREALASPPRERPKAPRASPYVGSGACRGCHPSEHASFTRTYHRTMTQDASARTVLAPLDGRPLELDGRAHALTRRGDGVFATMPGDSSERRVVLSTGSHREQAYWTSGRREGELSLFPFVWLVRERRFVARRDAFLTPPLGAERNDAHWSSSCIACHAVAGEPGHDARRDTFDTRVVELGVACEACHGPGAAHADKHRDPVARYVQHASDRADPTIVDPRRLPPGRSAAVCGQCHAYAFPRDEEAWWSTGYARAFRAGDELAPSRILLGPDVLASDDPRLPRIDAAVDSLFWPDGTIRVGGREYNGLALSPCFVRGAGERKMTCLSCHAMHAGDPAGQIAPDRTGDRACTTCHGATREHSHHARGSAGASCVGCHMAKTSYALLSAARSHRIESPSAALTADTGKPNACNLCHLDESLAWTSGWLATWYGAPPVALDAERETTAEGVYAALTGDAAVRVLIADALGSRDSREARAARAARPSPGDGWQAVVLAELVSDPYAAVRFVAERSLRAQPGFEDFVAGGDARADVLARARARGDAPLDAARVRALLAKRDLRAVTIAE